MPALDVDAAMCRAAGENTVVCHDEAEAFHAASGAAVVAVVFGLFILLVIEDTAVRRAYCADPGRIKPRR